MTYNTEIWFGFSKLGNGKKLFARKFDTRLLMVVFLCFMKAIMPVRRKYISIFILTDCVTSFWLFEVTILIKKIWFKKKTNFRYLVVYHIEHQERNWGHFVFQTSYIDNDECFVFGTIDSSSFTQAHWRKTCGVHKNHAKSEQYAPKCFEAK